MADNTGTKNAAKAGEKEKKEPGPFAVLSPLDLVATLTDAGITLTDEQKAALPTQVFAQRGEYVGKTSKQAIGQAVAAHGGGTYVAVPKRSFTPRKVESVGVPRLKWS